MEKQKEPFTLKDLRRTNDDTCLALLDYYHYKVLSCAQHNYLLDIN